MEQKKEIEKLYQKEKVAAEFDKERRKYKFQEYKHQIETSFLKKNILKFGKNEKIKVLDVACGTGRMLYSVNEANSSAEYHGLDTSKSMIKHLKEKANKKEIKVELKIGDATNLPYEDNFFEVVYTYHLTWHLPLEMQKKIFKEMMRVTKTEGYIVFDILNKEFIWEKSKKIFGKEKTEGIHKMQINEVKNLFKEKETSLEKLSDFPVKNKFFYSFLNIQNRMRKILPNSWFHMIYFSIKK